MDNAAAGRSGRTGVGVDTPPASHRGLHDDRRGKDHRALAWTIIGLGSGLPSAVAVTLGLDVARVGVAAVCVLAAIAASVFAQPERRALRGLVTVMTLLSVFLHVELYVLRAPAGGVVPFTGGPVWRQLVAWQVLSASVTIGLLCLRRIRGSGLVAVGDLDAPAARFRGSTTGSRGRGVHWLSNWRSS